MTPEQQRMIDIVNPWIGCSLNHCGDVLQAFFARVLGKGLLCDGVSDCGLFALAVWTEAGVKHPLIGRPYVNGMAIAWIETIAKDLNAVRHVHDNGKPKGGALMHYFSHRPSYNDHVEFCLEDPGHLLMHHAGGGRAHCAIGEGCSDVLWSSGRPLQRWYDADALLGAS